NAITEIEALRVARNGYFSRVKNPEKRFLKKIYSLVFSGKKSRRELLDSCGHASTSGPWDSPQRHEEHKEERSLCPLCLCG
ncbi:hypothetical protein, partial [uncultured Lamprocystis sp.]|uniref:hypothetical protein n=1 Tax=uncultured Lamprocystis sp. TaxID=543132 RepID=UPI0025F20588